MQKHLFLLLTILMLASCSKDDGTVNIRLSNISGETYENIIVQTYKDKIEYNTLEPGQFSEYMVFEDAYRYAYVELTIDDEIYKLEIVDFVGETPLENGNYIYEINAYNQPNGNYLSLTFIEE